MTRHFARWLGKTNLSVEALCRSVEEMERGLIDANLGGGIIKKRVALFAAALLISTSGFAEEVKREAVIVSVDGANINAQSRGGPLTVVLSPGTKITETSGLAKRKGRDAKSLLPGLIFTVEGDQQGAGDAPVNVHQRQ